jgi:translation elongation factor EF-Ts
MIEWPGAQVPRRESACTEQAFVKDPDITVGKLLPRRADASVKAFVRFDGG